MNKELYPQRFAPGELMNAITSWVMGDLYQAKLPINKDGNEFWTKSDMGQMTFDVTKFHTAALKLSNIVYSYVKGRMVVSAEHNDDFTVSMCVRANHLFAHHFIQK